MSHGVNAGKAAQFFNDFNVNSECCQACEEDAPTLVGLAASSVSSDDRPRTKRVYSDLREGRARI